MRHGYANAHIHSDGDCDSNVYSDGDCDSNCHIHADGDGDSNVYANSDSDSNSNGNGYCDCDRTAAAFTDATATTDTAGASEPIALSDSTDCTGFPKTDTLTCFDCLVRESGMSWLDGSGCHTTCP